LYFSSKSNIVKNVVLLFDLNFPILKDKHFLIYFKKFFRRREHRNYFYLAFFDKYLFLFKNFQKYELENCKLDESVELQIKEKEFENRKSYPNINSMRNNNSNYLDLAKIFTRNYKGENDNDENNDNIYNKKNDFDVEENEKKVSSEEEILTIENKKESFNDNDSLNYIRSKECKFILLFIIKFKISYYKNRGKLK